MGLGIDYIGNACKEQLYEHVSGKKMREMRKNIIYRVGRRYTM